MSFFITLFQDNHQEVKAASAKSEPAVLTGMSMIFIGH